MKRQISFAEAESDGKKRVTRRQRLSDEALEDALYDGIAMRTFAGAGFKPPGAG